MKFVYFTHSLVSCWNHGNAHFLRGLLRELIFRGHKVRVLEPADGWSRSNLEAEQGPGVVGRFAAKFPELAGVRSTYGSRDALHSSVDDADVVIVHEWTEPQVVSELSSMKLRRRSDFTLLFHDTHHRAVSDPESIRQLGLEGFDAILAFGQSLADVYERRGWRNRVFVFHEAADVRLFAPPNTDSAARRTGAVWIGNWGDEERSEELTAFLLRPTRDASIPLDVYGVRYPETAIAELDAHGAKYLGWLANDRVPEVFARHLFTVHVPRRFYTRALGGIPTIRVFEALACGIPLLCAPWQDSEGLFRSGRDYLSAATAPAMVQAMRSLSQDADLRRSLSKSGFEIIRNRHTCAHRADELIAIAERLRPRIRGAA